MHKSVSSQNFNGFFTEYTNEIVERFLNVITIHHMIIILTGTIIFIRIFDAVFYNHISCNL